jgi:rsbT antagonist protein RsbS
MNTGNNSVSLMKVRDILMVTMPSDPDDSTVAALQENVLGAMERYSAKGLILDISAVETLDSFFARTVSETAQMVSLMGGRTIIVGMQPMVAITATQMGLALTNIETALNVDRALDQYAAPAAPRKPKR